VPPGSVMPGAGHALVLSASMRLGCLARQGALLRSALPSRKAKAGAPTLTGSAVAWWPARGPGGAGQQRLGPLDQLGLALPADRAGDLVISHLPVQCSSGTACGWPGCHWVGSISTRDFSPLSTRSCSADGLAAVGAMITRYRGGGRFTTDDEIARITVALRDLRVRDDAWARMDPAHADGHRRLWIDVVRRAQPGHVAAPAALLALAAWQSGNGAMQARPIRLRPVARELRAAAAPASVGPASEGGERS
jgi:Domain of unknown function (DUF4192)